MSAGDTTLTITGNLTADPELRFTGVSRGFAITEGLSVANPSAEIARG
jgi:single-stranded DNA-binding protein